MIRSLLQTVLCISLCPLLAAQQTIAGVQQQAPQQPAPAAAVATTVQPILIATAHGTQVELSTLDSLSAADATLGEPVRFAVTRDVVVNGATVFPAGMAVNGTITKVRYGSYRTNRGDELNIRLTDLEPGKLIKLRLTAISSPERTYPGDPAYPAYPGYPMMHGPSQKGVVIFTIIMVALLTLALLGGDR
jgi:hypothetical protein